MNKSIIILLSLIVLIVVSVLAKPIIIVASPFVDNGFMLSELSDDELVNIKGQFLANEVGNKYIGGGIYIFNGLSDFWENVLKAAKVPDSLIELIKNMPKGEYLVEAWKDPITGKIIIEITPLQKE